MKKIALGLGLITSTIFAGNQFEININNDTIELAGSLDLKQSMTLPADSEYSLDVRFLKTEEEEIGEDGNYIANIGFKVVDSVSDVNGGAFGLGMDVLYTDTDKDIFFAIPFTLYGSYTFNEKLFIDTNLKYSPKILSYGDGESYKEARATINYNATSNAIVYLGARMIEAKFENYELEYDKTAFGGFKFQF